MIKKMFLGLRNSCAYEAIVSINSENALVGVDYYKYEPMVLSNPSNMESVKSYLWNMWDGSEIRSFCNKRYGSSYKPMESLFKDIMNDNATTAQEFLKGSSLFIDEMTTEIDGKLVLFKKQSCCSNNGFEYSEDGNLTSSLVELLCGSYYNSTIPKLYLSLLDKVQCEMSDTAKNKWQENIKTAIEQRYM